MIGPFDLDFSSGAFLTSKSPALVPHSTPDTRDGPRKAAETRLVTQVCQKTQLSSSHRIKTKDSTTHLAGCDVVITA